MDIKYKVILTNRAEIELNEIFEYISKTLMAEKAAYDLMNKIEKQILILENVPEAFSVIEHYSDSQNIYRKLVINNYVAIYRVDKENKIVHVVRIVYGGRNYLNEL